MSLLDLSKTLQRIHRRNGGDGENIMRADIRDDDEWWRRAVESEYERECQQWDALVERDGIPLRLATAVECDTAQPSEAMTRAELYMRDSFWSGECLLLAGATGIGKSYAAIAALKMAPRAARGFRYFPALCGELLDPQRRQAALAYVKEQHFMVFDDIGVEYVKDGGLVEAFFDEIVWHREGNEMPTIFTTNLTAEQLKTRLSDRIIDRLRGWGTVCAVGGPSLR
jgi:DNA replication protein DnaC